MIGAAATHWEMMDGQHTDDLMRLPLDRFLNRLVEWFRARLPRSDFDVWLTRLDVPPPGVTPRMGRFSDEEMAATFRASMESTDG